MMTKSLRWRRATWTALAVAVAVWVVSPEVPKYFPPNAPTEVRLAGQDLFVHAWQPNDPRAHGDGLGPVFNANSCVACHFQGGVGGGGDNTRNVAAFEVLPNLRQRKVVSGLVHAHSVGGLFSETPEMLRECFPIVPGGDRVVGNCSVHFEDFDPLRIESTNSIALFGDGLIDRISGRAVKINHVRSSWHQVKQEFAGELDTIGPGRPHILADGRIGKFGWKAQFATLTEFVAAACANELGLGNPMMEQARPLGSDYHSDKADLGATEFRQLVAFIDTLSRPEKLPPADPAERAHAQRGEKLFTSIGCAVCHTPDLGNVTGLYSNLLLHRLAPRHSDGYRHEIQVEVPLPSTHPAPEEWRTAPLWGVADSAPYFHDGGSATLEDAILRHDGDASTVTRAYKNLPIEDQQAIMAFLKTLKAPAKALPAQPYITAGTVAVND